MKTQLLRELSQRLVGLTLAFLGLSAGLLGSALSQENGPAVGTVDLRNGTLTRAQWDHSETGVFVNVPPNADIVYGLAYSTDLENPEELYGTRTLLLPLGTPAKTDIQAGFIDAPDHYVVPGTTPGQRVLMMVAGWSASFGQDWRAAKGTIGAYYGETDIRLITLGASTNLPAPTIWSNTPRLFLPLRIGYPKPIWPPPPDQRFSIRDTVAIEGANSQPVATFVIDCNASTRVGWVHYYTLDGTAVGGEDYVPTNGIAYFEPGQTRTNIQVALLRDSRPEPDEHFRVRLIPGPSLDRTTAIATISEARLVNVRRAPGGAEITARTVAGRRYALESSFDLQLWTVVPGAENATAPGELMTFLDARPNCCASQFYRLLLPDF